MDSDEQSNMDQPTDDLFGLPDITPMMDLFSNNVLHDDIMNPDLLGQTDGANLFLVGNIPPKEEFPGPFNFMLTMDTTGQKWVYSQPLEQVFISMNKVLVLNFHTELQIPANNSYFIRALPVYSSNEHVNLPVNRCTFHSFEDDPQSQAHHVPEKCRCKDFNNVGHVVRAQCRDAIYCFDEHSGRHSVMIPVNRPQPGSDKIAIPYSFSCKTSCPGGMMRRAIHLIFTLESATGFVLGRRSLGVKICSCPKRDKDRQEKDYWAEKHGELQRKRPQQASNNEPPKKIKQESLDPLQTPQVGTDGNLRHEIKEFKKMFDDFTKHVNEMNNRYNKLLEKMDRIEELQQNSLF